MQKVLPPNARIGDTAKETIQECVSEFIAYVASLANDKCTSESRKIVTADDIISAMSAAGFDNYVEPLTIYLSKMRQINEQCVSRQNFRASNHNLSFRQLEPRAPWPSHAVSYGPTPPPNGKIPLSRMDECHMKDLGDSGSNSSCNKNINFQEQRK